MQVEIDVFVVDTGSVGNTVVGITTQVPEDVLDGCKMLGTRIFVIAVECGMEVA